MPYRQDIYLEEVKIRWNALFQTKAIEYEVKLSIMDPGILESQVRKLKVHLVLNCPE